MPLALLGRMGKLVSVETDGVDVRKSMFIDVVQACPNKDLLEFLDMLFLRDVRDRGFLKLFDDGVLFPLLCECFDVG